MATLLEKIRTQQAADNPVLVLEPLIVDVAEWNAWDGTDETCSWVSVGKNRWAHRVSGLVFIWKMAYVLPGDDVESD